MTKLNLYNILITMDFKIGDIVVYYLIEYMYSSDEYYTNKFFKITSIDKEGTNTYYNIVNLNNKYLRTSCHKEAIRLANKVEIILYTNNLTNKK